MVTATVVKFHVIQLQITSLYLGIENSHLTYITKQKSIKHKINNALTKLNLKMISSDDVQHMRGHFATGKNLYLEIANTVKNSKQL